MRRFVLICVLAASLSLQPSCNEYPGTVGPESEGSLVEQSGALSVGGLLAPATKVDPDVWTGFGTNYRRIVLVTVTDPALDFVADPGPSDAPRPKTSEPERQARLAELQETKTRILSSVEKSSSDPIEVRALYENFGLMALYLTKDQVVALSQHEEVVRVLPDRVHHADTVTSSPFISADVLQGGGFTGSGVGVAVLDMAPDYWSGQFGTCPSQFNWVDNTPGCAIAVWRNFNGWTGAPGDLPEDEPHYIASNAGGHGTNVAGIVNAIAPDSPILALNVFSWNATDSDYQAMTSDVIDALNWVATNAAAYNIRAANMSLGSERRESTPCNYGSYYSPIRTLWADHDVLCTIASGNDAFDSWLREPGCVTLAMTTAAQHDSELGDYSTSTCTQLAPWAGEVTCFSNINGMLDLVAPGRWITAAGLTKTGTSMAAPHVAGGLGLLQSYWQSWAGYQISYGAQRRLFAEAYSLPHNGMVRQGLDLNGGFSWNLFWGFTYYYRDSGTSQIPLAPSFLEFTRNVTGYGWNIASLYLHVEVIHPTPEDVLVTLISPVGTQVSFALPAGASNFTGFIGRDYYHGIFTAFAGQNVDGDWIIRLSDTVAADQGNYVSATPYWVQDTCTPFCPGGGCGDDRCGGSCGTCPVGWFCNWDHTCVACVPDCAGRTCGSDRCGGTCGRCDDGLYCNGAESCVDTACESGNVPCSPDTLICTRTCDEPTQQCNTVLEPGYCLIGGACYLNGAINPANSCQECNTAVATDAWTDDNSNSCSDADACTVGDFCSSGSCISGGPLGCDDGNPCTTNGCNPATGCTTTNNTNPCDDGSACTVGDTCGGGSCVPGAPLNCADGNPCTDDSCNPATGCVNTNNTSPCSDGSACTTGDVCSGGVCQSGPPLNCDDGNPCTNNGCSPATGCTSTNNTNPCDDGSSCTVGDTCGGGSCIPGAPLNCADGNPCTDDSCSPATGCVNTNNTSACSDGNACTTSDVCSGGVCQPGSALNCDDGNLCTTNGCDPASGCTSFDNTAACDDSDACTSGDQCGGGSCQPGALVDCSDGNLCTDDVCDPASGCANPNNTAACDDGNACTSGDVCSGGSCQSGPALNCDDGNVCTTNGCDPASGCTAANNTSPCDDSDACTTGDQCSGGSCQAGSSIDCSDGNSCTDDLCDPVAGCNNPDNAAACDDGNACTSGDTCSGGSCQPGPALDCDDGNVCTTNGCDSATGCTSANNADPCDDSDACTVGDTCSGGSCQPGAPLDCSDGDICTDDVCDPVSGCANPNNSVACDDGDACTAGDACSGGGCQSGAPLDCDDGNLCTTNGCDPASGCTTSDNADPCDDGDACSTSDVCASGSCQSGAPLDCDDGNHCTDDVCDSVAGCTNTNNTVACDDADACTAGDVCAGGSCQAGSIADCDDGNSCTDDSCDSASGCINAPNADACDDQDACTMADACSAGVCQGAPLDEDGDGYGPESCGGGDCDDTNPAVNPGEFEGGSAAGTCDDGLDNDCNGDTDSDQASCASCQTDADCNDGNLCNGSETCANGACAAGAPLACDDGDACTDDDCDPSQGCTYTMNAAPCDDGDACTMADTCAGGSCQGEPLDADGDGYGPESCGGLDCDDGNASVSPGEFEGGAGSASCQDGVDNDCDGSTDAEETTCAACAVDADCADGNLCNGSETCQAVVCTSGAVLECDDGNPCTADGCNPAAGCIHGNNTAACDDGEACTTGDVCSGGNCAGQAVDCSHLDDACNQGSCDPASGSCAAAPVADAMPCDDGDDCTDGEACQAGVCQGGTDVCQEDGGTDGGTDGGGDEVDVNKKSGGCSCGLPRAGSAAGFVLFLGLLWLTRRREH